MKFFFRYQSEVNEFWTVMREHDQDEKPEDAISPSGQPAVVMTVDRPVDECMFTLRPAYPVKNVTDGKPPGNSRYYLQISNPLNEADYVTSQQAFALDEASKVIALFSGQPYERAKKLFINRKY
jgi:hypothetical protein